MRVAMIGTGYVGLVSGACFADFGHSVVCIDKDDAKIARLKDGGIPIYEPGLDALVANNVRDGRLSFATEPAEAIAQADAVFIAVGTPSRRGDGHADLSYVHAAAAEIADLMQGFTVVVTKSTVPVGTGDEIERIIRERRPDAEFAVVSNPEFLRDRLTRLGGEAQPAVAHIIRHQGVQAGFIDRNAAVLQARDLGLVLVDAHHAVAEVGETGARDEAHIAGSDHRHAHGLVLVGESSVRHSGTEAPAPPRAAALHALVTPG